MSEERLNENMENMETMADYEKEIEESFKKNEDTPVWEKFAKLMEEKTPLQVEIAEVVNGGVTAYVDGIRGFIPASKLAASYVENLEEWVGKTIDVLVITVEEERKKLVLSGRELAREKEQEEKKKRVEQCQVGAVMEGTVETIKDYGVDEQYFLETLDQMVEDAFDDQCTGCNPRYPLLSEIKEMYLKAYYGE